MFVYPDIDECSASSPVCDINANCSNTRGSYYCTCKAGFTGDEKTCQGKLSKIVKLIWTVSFSFVQFISSYRLYNW